MNIILASLAHVDVMAEIHQNCFDQPWTAAAFSSALSSPGALACIAQTNEPHKNEPLGMVLIRSGGGEAEILTIATLPLSRKQGVARALMVDVMDKVKTAGAQKIFLEVAANNPPALGLYTNLGFEQVGVRQGYYADGQDAKVLLKSFE